MDEDTLLQLGYLLLSSGRRDDAIQVFKLEVGDYPKYWNAYHFLGQAYMEGGQRDLATQNFEKSVDLNPRDLEDIDMLKKLKEQK